MKKNSRYATSGLELIAADAKTLLTDTSHIVEEKVVEARKRLAASLERGKERAIEGAKATDEAIHEHPYYAIGVAFGIGAVVGCLFARRH